MLASVIVDSTLVVLPRPLRTDGGGCVDDYAEQCLLETMSHDELETHRDKRTQFLSCLLKWLAQDAAPRSPSSLSSPSPPSPSQPPPRTVR